MCSTCLFRGQTPKSPSFSTTPPAHDTEPARDTENSCPMVGTVCCTCVCLDITQDCAWGRRSLGLKITRGDPGVHKEMVAGAGVFCLSDWVGASPQPHGLLPEWTPPPAHQPIRPGTGILLKLKAFCTAIPVKFFRRGKLSLPDPCRTVPFPASKLAGREQSAQSPGSHGHGLSSWIPLPTSSPCLSLRARHWWELGPLGIWGLVRSEARAVVAWSPPPPCNKSCSPGQGWAEQHPQSCHSYTTPFPNPLPNSIF